MNHKNRAHANQSSTEPKAGQELWWSRSLDTETDPLNNIVQTRRESASKATRETMDVGQLKREYREWMVEGKG